MEENNSVDQDKSYVDLNCSFAQRFMLPTCLFEDDDEMDNRPTDLFQKSSCFDARTEHSSSKCNTALSSNCCEVLNGYDCNEKFPSEFYHSIQDKNELPKEVSSNKVNQMMRNTSKYISPDAKIFSQQLQPFQVEHAEPTNFSSKQMNNYAELEIPNVNRNDFIPQIYAGNLKGTQTTNRVSERDTFNNLNQIDHNLDLFETEIGNLHISQGLNKNDCDIYRFNTDDNPKNNFYNSEINFKNFSTIPPNKLFGVNNLLQQPVYNYNLGSVSNAHINPALKSYDMRNHQNFISKYMQNHQNFISEFQPTNLTQYHSHLFMPNKITIAEPNQIRRNSNMQNKHIQDINAEDYSENEKICNDGSLHEFLKSANNKLVSFLKTQKGSRIIQKFMSNNIPPDCVDLLFVKILPQVKELMIDNYGNYFMQRLIQLCTSKHKMLILKRVSLCKI